jgi:hypothetical protein
VVFAEVWALEGGSEKKNVREKAAESHNSGSTLVLIQTAARKIPNCKRGQHNTI